MARDDRLEQGGEFGVLQRQNRIVAGNYLGGVVDGGEVFAGGFGGGNGNVEHQRAMDHVAEVEQAGDRALLRVNQHVAGVAVVMDDLGAQARQLGHEGDEAVEHAADQSAVGGIADEVGGWAQLNRAAGVPYDALARCRVEEVRERTV